jgi:hypothetical protein
MPCGANRDVSRRFSKKAHIVALYSLPVLKNQRGRAAMERQAQCN